MVTCIHSKNRDFAATKLVPGRPALILLSVLIPLYNEEELVGALIERVLRVELPRELNAS